MKQTVNASTIDKACFEAALRITQADGLLITAGAGMGIDSGLPDFRGEQGFWKAYPALGKLGMSFSKIANPRSFEHHPEIAWGFYGHRLQLYRRTQPHEGFKLLFNMADKLKHGAAVFTSNLDGQFQKAGLIADRVLECHGSIHHLQCTAHCGQMTWRADDFNPEIDEESCLLLSPLPLCPECGALARPNILMFGDYQWDETRTDWQYANLQMWLGKVRSPVVIEMGAGLAIPTVRSFGEQIGCPLIRINPDETETNANNQIGIPVGALIGISRISELIESINRI